FVPWFVFLFPALKEIPGRVRQWREGLSVRAQANVFFGVWAGVIMLFFSFSTRQEYYSLPVLPALALLTGSWLQRESESSVGGDERRSGVRASTALLVIGVLAFVAAMTMLAVTHLFPPGADIG